LRSSSTTTPPTSAARPQLGLPRRDGDRAPRMHDVSLTLSERQSDRPIYRSSPNLRSGDIKRTLFAVMLPTIVQVRRGDHGRAIGLLPL
jgi:hypothetical protein